MAIQRLDNVLIVVDDLEATKARSCLLALLAHGAELIGEVVEHDDAYRLCYVRGPEGMMVALAEQLTPE